jgi:hypothetical protein
MTSQATPRGHHPSPQRGEVTAEAECLAFLPMSGENHEGNKSPDIYDDNDQRWFLCSRAMKHEAMKAYEAQGSSLLLHRSALIFSTVSLGQISEISTASPSQSKTVMWLHNGRIAMPYVQAWHDNVTSLETSPSLNLTIWTSGGIPPFCLILWYCRRRWHWISPSFHSVGGQKSELAQVSGLNLHQFLGLWRSRFRQHPFH